MEKQCLDCQETIKGRSDKKFCNDQCRTNYNNKLKADVAPAIKKINTILKNNRNILEKINPEGKIRISKSKLIQHEFNFTYFTHTYVNPKGQTYFFCYDFGYLPIENEQYLLVKREL